MAEPEFDTTLGRRWAYMRGEEEPHGSEDLAFPELTQRLVKKLGAEGSGLEVFQELVMGRYWERDSEIHARVECFEGVHEKIVSEAKSRFEKRFGNGTDGVSWTPDDTLHT